MKVNWEIGTNEWAFKNLAEHIQKELTEIEHVNNNRRQSDVDIYLTTASFRRKQPSKKTILHLDGNRWYENHIRNKEEAERCKN